MVIRQVSFCINLEKGKDFSFGAEFAGKFFDINHLVLYSLWLALRLIEDVFHLLWFAYDLLIIEIPLSDNVSLLAATGFN